MSQALPATRVRRTWIAYLLVTAALMGAAAGLSLLRATPATAARSAPTLLAAVSPQAPTPRNLTFYLHNNTLAKDVNGVSTPYVFDTLQKFGGNNTITNYQQVVQDWYLFPSLAGNLTVNGSITLHAFVSVLGASPSLQSQTLTIDQVNATGAETQVVSANYGAAPWFNTPHDLVLTIPGVHFTFPAGSSIRVLLSIQLGVRTGTVWYNGSWVPSHLVIQSDDFAQIRSLAFLDAQGVPHQSFDPLAADKTITIQANVSDPLGGYDIAWANLSLEQPGGAILLAMAPMTQTAGTPLSYLSTFELAFNYGGHPTGRYNATASVLDNSGMYFFEEFYSTGPFLAQLASFFYVGGLPVYVNVQAVDSESHALDGATIDLVSAGLTVDAQTSDTSGLANFTMAKGSYTFEVVWENISVAMLDYNATANVSAASPVVVTCQVYYPAFHAEDANGVGLGDASLLFVRPDGTEIGPYKTDASGNATLVQAPVGSYGVLASWRGVSVYQGTQSVSSNGVISFQTAVYELTVLAKASDGTSLSGVFVSVVDSTGLVFDAGVTAASGSVVLRLPAGNYTVDYRYITTVDGSSYDSGVRTAPVALRSSTTTTVTLADFPIPFTSTLAFLFALAYGISVAVLLAVLVLVLRRMRRDRSPPTEPEKKA